MSNYLHYSFLEQDVQMFQTETEPSQPNFRAVNFSEDSNTAHSPLEIRDQQQQDGSLQVRTFSSYLYFADFHGLLKIIWNDPLTPADFEKGSLQLHMHCSGM